MIAVATGHAKTSQAAFDVLEAGGTAIDACIAAALMAFVAEPVLAGPLGGGFLLHVPRDGQARMLDAFVQTPMRARSDQDIRAIEADFGTSTQTFHIGAGTVAASGLMPALFDAHAARGRIPMTELAAPAVKAARDGLTLTPFQARLNSIVAPILTASTGISALYAEDGKLRPAGTQMHNAALADVLEVSAIEGHRIFVDGEVGQALCQMDGSHLTLNDLRRYTAQYRTPLNVQRGDAEILLNPAPSIGGTQIALALMLCPHRANPVERAACLAAIHELRSQGEIDTSSAVLGELRRTLSRGGIRQTGTTHISVIDQKGDGAALTLSNGTGAGLLVPGTGIMPNNMLGEEDVVPGGIEGWQPNTRLTSAMCPTALRRADGGVSLLGSGGSNRIRSALTHVALNLLDHGMRLEQAIEAPRLHVDGIPSHLDAEAPLPEGELVALRNAWPEMLHWKEPSMYFGGVHAVRRDRTGRQVEAAADPRREGTALSRS